MRYFCVFNGVSTDLSYDQNGAITSYAATGTANDKYISYNSANQLTQITAGGSYLDDPNATARDEFKYTPDGARYYKKSTYWQAGVLRTEHTFYIGSYETTFYDTSSSVFQSEKVLKGDVLFIRKTPYVGSVVETQQFLHRDQLGSVTAVTNGSAGGITQLAFESFGSRRNSTTLTGNISLAQLDDLFTKRADLHSAGYTGHESLDRTGFIHMNGRVYDPRLSRFLSPDPLVQAPTNSQSWNRYSYVFNNPLKYSDPSGYEAEPEEIVVTGNECGEKCQREGWGTVFHNQMMGVGGFMVLPNGMMFDGKSTVIFDGRSYNISNRGQRRALVKAGGGSKSDFNNITAALADAE